MSAAALAAGATGNGAKSRRRPRVNFRTEFSVESSVKKSLMNIRRKTESVWNNVRSMQQTIDELRAENARLRRVIDGVDTDIAPEYDSDDSRPEIFLERNYKRIGNSRFFAPRQSSVETD